MRAFGTANMAEDQGVFAVPCSLFPAFSQQRRQHRQQRLRDDLGTFGGGMNAVRLNRAGNMNEVFVDHGHECGVMLGGEVAEDLFEGLDVVTAVVGGQRDAGKQHFDVSIFESSQHSIQIAARLAGGQAAQSVVAAEFDDDNLRMQEQD